MLIGIPELLHSDMLHVLTNVLIRKGAVSARGSGGHAG